MLQITDVLLLLALEATYVLMLDIRPEVLYFLRPQCQTPCQEWSPGTSMSFQEKFLLIAMS